MEGKERTCEHGDGGVGLACREIDKIKKGPLHLITWLLVIDEREEGGREGGRGRTRTWRDDGAS